MKVTLKELCWLLRDERRGLTELQQQFAKAKATWETERAELKGHTAQVSLPPCPLPSQALSCQTWEQDAQAMLIETPSPHLEAQRQRDSPGLTQGHQKQW